MDKTLKVEPEKFGSLNDRCRLQGDYDGSECESKIGGAGSWLLYHRSLHWDSTQAQNGLLGGLSRHGHMKMGVNIETQ